MLQAMLLLAQLAVRGAAEGWTWRRISPSGALPPGRIAHSAVVDQGTGNMLVFGGSDGNDFNDTWELAPGAQPGEAWAQLAPSGARPSPRHGHSAVFVPSAGTMLVFGGYGSGMLNDAWQLAAGGQTWAEVSATGSGPSARYYHSAVFIDSTDSMIVFGGHDGDSYLNDLWSFSWGARSWARIIAASGALPGARYFHSAVYEASEDKMLVFGGTTNSGTVNELWEFAFAGNSWAQISPSGASPPGRYGHTAVLDDAAGGMLLYGGSSGRGNLNDLWLFTVSEQSWSEISPSGALPPGGCPTAHSAVLSQATGEMVVFGGYGDGYRNDLWALALPQTTTTAVKSGHTDGAGGLGFSQALLCSVVPAVMLLTMEL